MNTDKHLALLKDMFLLTEEVGDKASIKQLEAAEVRLVELPAALKTLILGGATFTAALFPEVAGAAVRLAQGPKALYDEDRKLFFSELDEAATMLDDLPVAKSALELGREGFECVQNHIDQLNAAEWN